MRSLGVVMAALLVGCPAPEGKIDPGSAKVEDVLGYWHHWGPGPSGDEQQTVFGFASAAEATWELPLTENALDAGSQPASIVYLGSPYFQLSAGQIATFGVSGGAIQQTVLGDRSALPGTKFETKIYELTPRQTMVLESKNDPSGRRTWQWFERCQSPNAAGWNTFNTTSCFADFSIATAMIFDRFGDLHAVSGRGARSKPCDVPTFADVTRACVPRISLAPDLRNASLAVGPDDVLRMAWVDQQNQLHLRERALRGDTWTDSVIDPTPGTTYELELYDDALGRRLVLTNAETFSPSLYAWDGAAWKKTVAALTTGGAFPTTVTSIARGPDGALVFSVRAAPWVLRETATGFEPWPLPDVGTTGVESVAVDARGRLHAVLPGAGVGTSAGGVGGVVIGRQGELGILEAGQWKRFRLPIYSGAWLAPRPDGAGRLMVALEKAVYPSFALLTEDGARLAQELIHADAPMGVSGSTLTHAHVTLEPAADGTLAATLDGQLLWVRGPGGPVRPQPAELQFKFNGKSGARVLSTDGKVDCSADCSVSYPVGSRVEVRVETEPGHVATLACPEMLQLGADRCFLDVRALQTQAPVAVTRTPVANIQQAGPVNGSAVGQRFGRLGAVTAYGTAMNPGARFEVDGVDFPLSTSASFGLAVFDAATRTGWHTALPVEALAVAPAADGGAWAVVRATAPTAFGSQMVGVAGKVTLARLRFSPSGEVLEAATLLAAAAFTVQQQGNQPVAAVQPDGAAAVVVTSTAGFPEQSLTEQTAVAFIDSAGLARARPVDAALASNAAVVLEGGQLFVGASVSGGARLVSFDAQAQRQGTRLVADAQVKAVSARAGRRGVLLQGSGASLDLGGGARTGVSVVGEFDTALSHLSSASSPSPGARGFALLPDGGAVLVDLQNGWRLNASLAPEGAGDALPLNGAQLFAAGQTERGLGLLLYLPQPLPVNGVRTVSGPLLLDLVPPR